MSEFTMPSLGADMEGATLTVWQVEPGSMVKYGDVIAVVETDKGAIEVEVFENGVVEELYVPEGTTLKVGEPMARIRGTEDKAGAAPPLPPEKTPQEELHPGQATYPETGKPPQPESEQRLATVEGKRVSPAARKRARELGLDPFQITGSGPDASVTLDDIEAEAAATVSTARPEVEKRGVEKEQGGKKGFEAAEMRRAISRAMARSKREIPHYYLGTTIDLQSAQRWLEDHNRERTPEERILMPALLLKATALALARYPNLNGHYVEDAFQPADNVHLGVAVHLRGGGLIAPALLDADKLSLQELMRRLQDLVGRARSGGLRSSEITGPTATVTSLGERGVETVYGIIYPPQVAMIGFGRIIKKPCAVDDAIAIHPVISATLAADHRVCDGHLGALFLNDIERRLQQPEDQCV